MQEPSRPQHVSTLSAMWLFALVRMPVGAALLVLFGYCLNFPEQPLSATIPELGRWQAAAAGRSPRGEVVVSGRVEAGPGVKPLVTPFSRKSVLAYTVAVKHMGERTVQGGKGRKREVHLLGTSLKTSRRVPYRILVGGRAVEIAGEVREWHLPTPEAVQHDQDPALPAWASAMPGLVHDTRRHAMDETYYETEEVALQDGDTASFIGVIHESGGRRRLRPSPGARSLVGYLRGRDAVDAHIARAHQERRDRRLQLQVGMWFGGLLLLPYELLFWRRRGAVRRRAEAP